MRRLPIERPGSDGLEAQVMEPKAHSQSIGNIRQTLVDAGLKPTRQRLAIGALLFNGVARHVSAEELHAVAAEQGHRLSMATVYNTLKQLSDVGLLRRIAVPSGCGYFDTDVGDHHHFYIPAREQIIDISVGDLSVSSLPNPPVGYCIDKVDVVIHLKPLESST